jgi:hypothetical protein
VRQWREWSSHQYDPGYWTAGRIPPFLKGNRLNRFGYVLVLIGFIGVVMLAGPIARGSIARGASDAGGAVVLAALILCGAMVLVGTFKLVRSRD